MTLKIQKQTEKKVTANYFNVASWYCNQNITEVELNAFTDLEALEQNIPFTTLRGYKLEYLEDPFKKVESNQIVLDFLQNNPSKTLFEAGLYLIELYIKNNIQDFQNAEII